MILGLTNKIEFQLHVSKRYNESCWYCGIGSQAHDLHHPVLQFLDRLIGMSADSVYSEF